MPRSPAPLVPMMLGNMRANGVRSLSVSCWLCHHGAVLVVDRWPDDVRVPAFGPRMVCTSCGIVGADARPNWTERPMRPSLTGTQQLNVPIDDGNLSARIEALLLRHSTYFDSLFGLAPTDDGQMRERFEEEASRLIDEYGETVFYAALAKIADGPPRQSEGMH